VAAWGRAKDEVRFFEINPQDVDDAARYFSFLKESPAATSVVLGDGRLSLERETADHAELYDVLALDAFSGDSIPVHLLTTQAFDVYWSRLTAQGVIAVHISNLMLNLRPVVEAAVAGRGTTVTAIRRAADLQAGASDSLWLLVTRDSAFPRRIASLADNSPTGHPVRAWTDDFSSLMAVLR
jgi:hypothetical protein